MTATRIRTVLHTPKDWRPTCVPGREEDGRDDAWFAHNFAARRSVRCRDYRHAAAVCREMNAAK